MADEDKENLNSKNETEDTVEIKPEDLTVEGEDSDDPAVLKQALEKKGELNVKIYERMKRAEGFTKDKDGKWIKKPKTEPKPKPKEEQPNSQAAQGTDPDEIADLVEARRGLTPAEIEHAKALAKGLGVSFVEATKTEGFQAFHKSVVAERKKEKAKLGGAKGSAGDDGEDKPLVASNMKREDHMALAKKHMG